MPDTQWPRFMVFQQEAPGRPFVHNGTVHAPDIEMALQNARDVFARRPEAVAMWVVPVDVIYTQTREELSKQVNKETSKQVDKQTGRPQDISTSGRQDFYVFAKFHHQDQCHHVGEVTATSLQAAMEAAIEKYDDLDPLWWWVFPKSAALSSAPRDTEPMFAPAREKTFKDQAEYPVVTMMREIRAKRRKQ
ncbi:MAG: phenylacetic acid degradation protein [Anaerolineales bacterium]